MGDIFDVLAPDTTNAMANVLLLDVPSGILCGIDLLSFTTSPRFGGIKDIPPGWHFIFTSETTSLSIREGFWFHAPANSSISIVRKWDPSTGALRAPSKSKDLSTPAPDSQEKHFLPYRQSASKDAQPEDGNWEELTKHITPQLLSHLTKNQDWQITSANCAQQDRDEIPGLTYEEVGEEGELGALGIDLKRTWREGATGRERTEGALDHSWALGNVVERWKDRYANSGDKWPQVDTILGQMQACFLMVLTISNFSCLEEWKRVVGLVLACKRAVRQRERWFASFMVLLKTQLERCNDVEGGLFDMSDEGGGLLRQWLETFKSTVEQIFEDDEGDQVKEALELLEAYLKQEYGWNIGEEYARKGMLELGDGEDEKGDYAPVVVKLEESKSS